ILRLRNWPCFQSRADAVPVIPEPRSYHLPALYALRTSSLDFPRVSTASSRTLLEAFGVCSRLRLCREKRPTEEDSVATLRYRRPEGEDAFPSLGERHGSREASELLGGWASLIRRYDHSSEAPWALFATLTFAAPVHPEQAARRFARFVAACA